MAMDKEAIEELRALRREMRTLNDLLKKEHPILMHALTRIVTMERNIFDIRQKYLKEEEK